MDNHILQNKVLSLSNNKQLLFGSCCMDRILHLYKGFEDELNLESDSFLGVFKSGYNNLSLLLDKVFYIILDRDFCSMEDFIKDQKKSLVFAPDTEEISSNFAVIAQNCAIGLSYIYSFLTSKDVKNIFYCSEKVIETIDMIGFATKLPKKKLALFLDEEVKIEIGYLDLIKEIHEPITSFEIEELRKRNKQFRINIPANF